MSEKDNVVEFTGITYAEVPPETVLEKAKAWGLKRVVVVGEDENGKLVWGMSFPDGDRINWMMDLVKFDLLHSSAKSR